MKVRVLGATGMLGREVMHSLEEYGYEADSTTRHSAGSYFVESRRIQTLTADALENVDVLVNCAGIVKQKLSTIHDMVLVNALGPHRLEELARQTGTRIIHVSTDCVFSHNGPHTEWEIPSPFDYYGLSKAAGELPGPHLTLRTSFIGWAEHGLVWDVLHRKEIDASTLFLWNGHTAHTVANVIAELVPLKVEGPLHLPGEYQTRNALVKKIAAALQRDILVRDNHYPMDRRLDSQRFGALGIQVPSFDKQLEELMLEKRG